MFGFTLKAFVPLTRDLHFIQATLSSHCLSLLLPSLFLSLSLSYFLSTYWNQVWQRSLWMDSEWWAFLLFFFSVTVLWAFLATVSISQVGFPFVASARNCIFHNNLDNSGIFALMLSRDIDGMIWAARLLFVSQTKFITPHDYYGFFYCNYATASHSICFHCVIIEFLANLFLLLYRLFSNLPFPAQLRFRAHFSLSLSCFSFWATV